MTDDASEKAVGPLAIGIDVGGSGIKAAVVDVDAGRLTSERLRVPTPVPSTPEAVIASIAPVGQASGQVERPRRDDPGRDRPARRDPRRRAQVRRQHRPGLDRLPGRRAADARCSSARSPSSTTPTRRGSPRCASVSARASAGQGHLPDARDRRRLWRVHRWRPRPEHRVRADGDPRPSRPSAGPRPPRGSSAGCRGRPGPPTSTSTSTASSS